MMRHVADVTTSFLKGGNIHSKQEVITEIYRLFDIIPIVKKIIFSEYKSKYYLFGFIPFLRFSKKHGKYDNFLKQLKRKADELWYQFKNKAS
jgi:hypothetical protein